MTEEKRKRGRPESCGVGVVAKMRRALLENGKVDRLIDVVYSQALGGCPAAQRILLDRIFPSLRAESSPVRVAMPADATLTEQARTIVKAATDGQISPDIAVELLKGIAALGQVQEFDDLRDRVNQLLYRDLA